MQNDDSDVLNFLIKLHVHILSSFSQVSDKIEKKKATKSYYTMKNIDNVLISYNTCAFHCSQYMKMYNSFCSL